MTLVVENASLWLGERALLRDFSLCVEPGEIVSIIGPSGAGKSSLLAWIAGTQAEAFRARGFLALDGRSIGDVPAHLRRIGVLQQGAPLFPHLSVAGNLAFALPRACRGRSARRARVMEALEAIELTDLADADPATLSGGERSRVALMQAMLAEPRALLLDEPFSHLDDRRRERVRKAAFAFIHQRTVPTLLVTHDLSDAPKGGRIVEPWPDS